MSLVSKLSPNLLSLHGRKITVTAIILLQVTCNLPLRLAPFKPEWTHLSDLKLAHPDFGQPDQIDVLLGVDVFVQVMCQGQQIGVPGSASAFEMDFGWVLAGRASICASSIHITSHRTSVITTGYHDLQRFWEIEELANNISSLAQEERMFVKHFKQNHSHAKSDRFFVPLPKKPHAN